MWRGSRRFNTIMLMKLLSGLTAYPSARAFNTGQYLNNYWSGGLLFLLLSTGWLTCSASHRYSTCCTCTPFSHLPVQSLPQRLRKESGDKGASGGILLNRYELHIPSLAKIFPPPSGSSGSTTRKSLNGFGGMWVEYTYKCKFTFCRKIIKMLHLGWIVGFPARSRENVLISLVPRSQNNLFV